MIERMLDRHTGSVVSARRGITRFAAFLALGLSLCAAPVLAKGGRPSRDQEFSIGTGGTVCEAQGVNMGARRGSVYDRQWAILCRDVASPVGTAWTLRSDAGVPDGAEDMTCGEAAPVALDNMRQVTARSCTARTTGLEWRVYRVTAGKVHYTVQGLSGYDSALRLALLSLVADRPVPGEVTVAVTGNSTSALNQARASVADPQVLIGQAYHRGNAGAFAEAAELFLAAPALERPVQGEDESERTARLHEMKVNRALQMSNLGQGDVAAKLFGEARDMAFNDPVQSRLGRNFEAIDALNRGDLAMMAQVLARPVASLAAPVVVAGGGVRLDRATVNGLNRGKSEKDAALFGQEVRLTVPERAAILDAQAQQLRGTAERLAGHHDKARELLQAGYGAAMSVREGRVVSIIRLRSQILSELALSSEAEGRLAEAEGLLRGAETLLSLQYPDSASLAAARARLAGFMARHGRRSEALELFRTVAQTAAGNREALVGMTNLMRPYFDMLTDGPQDSGSVSDLFLVSQLTERPGAADSLSLLARQLESGAGEAAALFRQSVAVGRDIERNRVLIAQASLATGQGTQDTVQLALLAEKQERLSAAQVQLLSALSAYPQFRAVSRNYVTLDELRASLKPGEAYLKMAQLGGAFYAVLVTPITAKGWRVGKDAGEIAGLVGTLRDSISININGVRQTLPFDVEASLALYNALLGPAAAELGTVRHLIAEPDGPLLQLPLNLLVTDQASVTTYQRNAANDEYDFRGIAWLGRTHAISTALSAASFRDARKVPASQARRGYLGMGENLPLGGAALASRDRGGIGAGQDTGCDWAATAWNRPISDVELRDASSAFRAMRPAVLTKAQFTDTAIAARGDLDDFRVLHFATHGLVSAPREGCPARPALLTSFGGAGSDGLLRFDEIFNLKLDADLVVLSACDTAAQASREATREAGLTTGGGQALDGLVRAFIAAGGRQVIASHWPAPDEYGATRRLFTRLFSGPGGESIGDALMQSQRALMDDAETSHPFYWSGFAVIGDGARAVGGQR